MDVPGCAQADSVSLKTKMDKHTLISELDEAIPKLMEKSTIPGLSIAVIRDGKILWHKDFGIKNTNTGEPVSENTIFEAASLTKPFFAYLIMKMVERGELELDTPLMKYVPIDYIEKMFIGHPIDLEGFRGDWFNKITARMCLSHSSGLPHDDYGKKPFPILFEPSTKFRYSADGYEYLQGVVEHIKGEPLEEIMRREILEPLKMKDSSMIWEERYETQAAVGHDLFGETDGKFRKRKLAHSAASLYTTARDYAQFVLAVINDKGLKSETVKEMLSPQINVDKDLYWSLSFGIEHTENGDAFWQWGDYVIFRNYITAYKEQRIGVVYLTNSQNGLSIGHELVELAIGGENLSLKWLNYPRYDSPTMIFLGKLRNKGINKATKTYNEFKVKCPDDFDERRMDSLGYSLLFSGKNQEAIKVFQMNAKSFPQSPDVYTSLGGAYLTIDNDELVMKTIQEALRIDPDNRKAFRMLKMVELMRTMIERGMNDALLLYSELRRKHLDDFNENQLNDFGFTLLSRKRIKEAFEIFKININAFPESPSAYFNIARAYMMIEDKEMAMKYLERSIKLDPYLEWARVKLKYYYDLS